jgi:hypothetical protein
MPATPGRIGFISHEFRTVKSDNATVLTRFGDFARKVESPIETYFDSSADASTVMAQRHTLLGSARRRFEVEVQDVSIFGSIDFSQVSPTVRLIDTERSFDGNALIVGMVADTQSDTLTLTLWGLAT